MYFELPFDLEENIHSGDFVVASYLVSGINETDALLKAGRFAVGQTVGTWIKLPGITKRMVEDYQARVLSLEIMPTEDATALLRVAFPTHNFADSFAMMQTALVGNDVSTALKVKLLDISFTKNALSHFRGPRHSVAGVREVIGVYDRPLVLNMIKPCIGYTADEGAALFYETAMGGVDMIKDDEVFSSVPVLNVLDRVRAYRKVSEQVELETGHKPLYIPNITSRPKQMHDYARMLLDEGIRACMVNYVTTGIDALYELTEAFGDKLIFLGHYAGAGMLNSPVLGYANPVLLGSFPRLAGADMVMTMYPGSPDGKDYLEFIKTVQKQKLSLPGIKPVLTVVGGGVTPLNLGHIVATLGNDVVLGIGGAIQGHPLGAKNGAIAVMAAVAAVMEKVSLEDKARSCHALQVALETWQQ